jgi:hypothetical protein
MGEGGGGRMLRLRTNEPERMWVGPSIFFRFPRLFLFELFSISLIFWNPSLVLGKNFPILGRANWPTAHPKGQL